MTTENSRPLLPELQGLREALEDDGPHKGSPGNETGNPGTHRISWDWHVYLAEWLEFVVNVGKYILYIDPMGQFVHMNVGRNEGRMESTKTKEKSSRNLNFCS